MRVSITRAVVVSCLRTRPPRESETLESSKDKTNSAHGGSTDSTMASDNVEKSNILTATLSTVFFVILVLGSCSFTAWYRRWKRASLLHRPECCDSPHSVHTGGNYRAAADSITRPPKAHYSRQHRYHNNMHSSHHTHRHHRHHRNHRHNRHSRSHHESSHCQQR